MGVVFSAFGSGLAESVRDGCLEVPGDLLRFPDDEGSMCGIEQVVGGFREECQPALEVFSVQRQFQVRCQRVAVGQSSTA